MSLVPQTPEQILKDYGTELAVHWGPTVLDNPSANRSSNLVRILSMPALSLADLQQKVEALIVIQDPNNLEGLALTAYAAQRGVLRKVGTQSKAVIVVTGQQGSTLPRGTELKDRFGTPWETTADIVLNSSGQGCAFGSGVVCSSVPGSTRLNEDELIFDNAGFPFIFAATNGQMLEIGGADESDDSLRNRLLNRGPLANVIGSVDNAISALYEIDGVNFARFTFAETCIGNGPMLIVHGGNDSQICDVIERRSGVQCNMVGESGCGSCNDIRFQRPCPLLLCIEVTVNCDCPTLTQDAIRDLIMSVAPTVSTQTKIRANDIAKLQQDIDSVRFQVKRPILMGCPDDNAPIYNDPISNEPIPFGTDNPFGLCGGVPECVGQNDFFNSIAINPWEYFIMDPSVITFQCSEEPESDCVQCE